MKIAKVPLVSRLVFAGLTVALLTGVDRAIAQMPAQPASAMEWLRRALAPATAVPGAGAANVPLRPHEPARDPTAPSPLLRELLKPAGKQSKISELPFIQIKGRIIGGLQPNSALLQIGVDDQQPLNSNAARTPHNVALRQNGNHSYLVQKGTELTIPGGGGDTQTLRVVEITADEVRIEIAPLGRVLTLN